MHVVVALVSGSVYVHDHSMFFTLPFLAMLLARLSWYGLPLTGVAVTPSTFHDHPLQAGDKLVFCDMAIYSMVKNNTFNGMPLPDLALYQDGNITCVKRFGYEDFRERLS